jgi:hypothetical protein
MIAKLSNRLTAAVVIGIALLSLTRIEPPRMARLDIISGVLWSGCKAQAMNRITSLFTTPRPYGR